MSVLAIWTIDVSVTVAVDRSCLSGDSKEYGPVLLPIFSHFEMYQWLMPSLRLLSCDWILVLEGMRGMLRMTLVRSR